MRLGRVTTSRTSGTLRALGRVALDENRVFPVRTGCEGWVSRIYPRATSGSAVRKGQPLASVYGRDYTTAQRSFLYALRASENPRRRSRRRREPADVDVERSHAVSRRTSGLARRRSPSSRETRQVILDVLLTAPAD